MTEEQIEGEGMVDETTEATVQTWVDRLVAESVELNSRLSKLRDFMKTDAYTILPWIEKDALNRQMQHMAAYAGVLDERLSRAPHDDPSNPELDEPSEVGTSVDEIVTAETEAFDSAAKT